MIDFRKLTHNDYEDILDISKDIWEGTDYLPEVFHEWVDDKGYFLGAIDTDKTKVIGVGKFSILPDGSGWLEGLRVHRDYRGRKIARAITEQALSIAEDYLNNNKINKIAFATHATNIESITLMKKLNFHLLQQYIIVSKEYKNAPENLSLEDFTVAQWDLSFEEFKELNYIKERNNILPFAFIFQEPTLELYNSFKKANAFVCINGHNGIFKYKGEPYFIAIEDNYESINTFMDYYLLKFKDNNISIPSTAIKTEDKDLITSLSQNFFESWNHWEADYFYFVKK